MILFDLMCTSDHVFEAWVHDPATFARPSAAGQLACPLCREAHGAKRPRAPPVATRRNDSCGRVTRLG